jgi:HEAT repeat protein
VLDPLVHLAESRALQQNWPVMARIFVAIVREEVRYVEDSDARRAFGLAVRRLTKPTFLRELARMLPRHPDQRDGLQQVLLRTGDEGAEALIDLLTNADLLTDRRAYLAALSQCRAAVPTLTHLLGDKRWYVVRNAADLLGEMHAGEAEAKLAELIRHPEERVRRAVAIALTRINSPRALHFAIATLSDRSAEVRSHIAIALGATKQPRAVQAILKALDEEQDGEAQAMMLAALGRAATPEAVERLVKTAREDGGIFRRRKLSAQRVAALLALGEAATPAAFAAVESLVQDRDRDVRDTATRVLANRGRPRRPTPVA